MSSSGLSHTNEDLQDVVKDGKIQREKIHAAVEQLLEAAKKGDTNILSKLIQENSNNKGFVNEIDANKRTALHFAAHGNHFKSIQFLLQQGANLNACDWDQWTPLMHALKAKSFESAKLLLDTPGIDLDTVSTKGLTPLHVAVMSGNKELVKCLIEKGVKILPEQKCESGSVLHFACTDTDIEFASFLVRQEPQLVNTKDENDITPLHIACASNNEPMALFLINSGADVNSVASEGATPLHIAADYGNKNIIASLISHGAVQKLDSKGQTPAMLSVRNKTKDIEEILREVKLDLSEGPGKSENSNSLKISAEQLKENGNKAFDEKDYEISVHWYSLAIDVDSITCEMFNRPSTLAHILYSNRSISHYRLNKYKEALEDAESSVHMAPDWPKGYGRKGTALAALDRKEESDAAFNKMKELEKQSRR